MADDVRILVFLRRIYRVLFLLAWVLLASVSHAEDSDLSGGLFHFSGFASLGVTKGGNDILGFRRELDREGVFDGDWSALAESSVGMQLDINPTGEWGGTVQLLAKDTLSDELKDTVSWAFLRYRFHPDWTLRAGRIGIDLYMLSDYRNVGFAYLWSRPPVEFYTPLSFDSFDGLSLDWATRLGSGILTTKVQVGESSNTFGGYGDAVELNLSPIAVFNLHWETERWQARVSASRLSLDKDDEYFPGTESLALALQSPFFSSYWPQAANYAEGFKVVDPDLYYFSTGLAYDSAPWKVQFEASYGESDTDLYPSLLSTYLSVGRQFGAVTPFVLAAWTENREERFIIVPPAQSPIPQLNEGLALVSAGLQTAYDVPRIDQHTLSLGVRWDLRYDIALKAQWDHSWVAAYGGGLWDLKAIPTEDMELNTFSINLNCIF